MTNKKLVFFSTVVFVFLIAFSLGCAEKSSDEISDENIEDDSNGESGTLQSSISEKENVDEVPPSMTSKTEDDEENDFSPVQTATVSISSPANGDTVNYTELVSGTSTNVSGSDLHLYILVNPIEIGEQWWVQSEATVSSDGSWQTLVYFGDKTDEHIGKEYRVSAIVISEELATGMKLNQVPSAECRVDKDILVTRG